MRSAKIGGLHHKEVGDSRSNPWNRIIAKYLKSSIISDAKVSERAQALLRACTCPKLGQCSRANANIVFICKSKEQVNHLMASQPCSPPLWCVMMRAGTCGNWLFDVFGTRVPIAAGGPSTTWIDLVIQKAIVGLLITKRHTTSMRNLQVSLRLISRGYITKKFDLQTPRWSYLSLVLHNFHPTVYYIILETFYKSTRAKMRCQVCIILPHGCDFLLYAADENSGSSWIIRPHNLQKNLSLHMLMANACNRLQKHHWVQEQTASGPDSVSRHIFTEWSNFLTRVPQASHQAIQNLVASSRMRMFQELCRYEYRLENWRAMLTATQAIPLAALVALANAC